MSVDECRADGAQSLESRCREVVERLSGLYGWRLDAARRDSLARQVARSHTGDTQAALRTIEQTSCRLRFAALFADLNHGGDLAGEVLAELFSIHWPEAGSTAPVRYGGYLFRSGLARLRRRLAESSAVAIDCEQVAADAASRALTTVRTRFRDCRDPGAFWGWTARVAERAVIDELRSGQATGGRSVHAASLDAEEEAYGDRWAVQAGGDGEERQVDAIAVRQELVRKCRLGKLSPDQREALVRSYWGGEKPQEIAAALSAERGAPVRAAQVSLWKHRGLQIMESNLRGRGYE